MAWAPSTPRPPAPDTMTAGTADVLIAAFRRALPLIVVLVILGAGAVNVKRQLDGPVYGATAQVFLSSTDLGAVLAGAQPSYVDPRRVMENALALARSPGLYTRAAEEHDLDPAELRSMISIEGRENADVIVFTATGSDRELTIQAANAVAQEYPAWRAEVSAAALRQAITRLEREIRTADDSTALEEQMQRLELMESLSTGNAMLLEPAGAASRLSPNPVRDSMLGAAIGLVIALLLAGVREVLDTRIRSEGEAEQILEAPLLGTISSLPKRARLVMMNRYEERYGDAYALLAANVEQFRREGEPALVAVTSASKEEGKSLTAANLAVALARRGLDVVLADFDTRRPTQASVFKLPAPSPGVIQAIRDGASAPALQTISLTAADRTNGRTAARRARAQSSAVQEAGGSLRILPAGGTAGGSLAQSPGVAGLLSKLGGSADIVLIDTPPALSTPHVTELSRLVDVVLVVVRQGHATRRNLRSLIRQAQNWHAPIGGIVVTDSKIDESYSYYAPH